MATKKERAHQIRIASLPGENTAERVGALLEDMADHQDGVDTQIETMNDELAETNREVAANKDAAAASITYTPATRNIDLKNAKAQVLASAYLPLATGSAPGLMSSQSYSRLYGIPNEAILDLGTVSSTDVGDAMAARSEYAGNRKIILIRYDTQGVSALKTTVIIQWCNGINETGQIKFVDKAQWRRNVTGTTGVPGAPTNAFKWERTGAHYLGYDAANRKIQLKDYNQTAFRDVQLPLATTSQAGIMSADDKKAVDKIGTIETNVGTMQTTVNSVKSDIEFFGSEIQGFDTKVSNNTTAINELKKAGVKKINITDLTFNSGDDIYEYDFIKIQDLYELRGTPIVLYKMSNASSFKAYPVLFYDVIYESEYFCKFSFTYIKDDGSIANVSMHYNGRSYRVV